MRVGANRELNMPRCKCSALQDSEWGCPESHRLMSRGRAPLAFGEQLLSFCISVHSQ
jgi:hypothetical protein